MDITLQGASEVADQPAQHHLRQPQPHVVCQRQLEEDRPLLLPALERRHQQLYLLRQPRRHHCQCGIRALRGRRQGPSDVDRHQCGPSATLAQRDNLAVARFRAGQGAPQRRHQLCRLSARWRQHLVHRHRRRRTQVDGHLRQRHLSHQCRLHDPDSPLHRDQQQAAL